MDKNDISKQVIMMEALFEKKYSFEAIESLYILSKELGDDDSYSNLDDVISTLAIYHDLKNKLLNPIGTIRKCLSNKKFLEQYQDSIDTKVVTLNTKPAAQTPVFNDNNQRIGSYEDNDNRFENYHDLIKISLNRCFHTTPGHQKFPILSYADIEDLIEVAYQKNKDLRDAIRETFLHFLENDHRGKNLKEYILDELNGNHHGYSMNTSQSKIKKEYHYPSEKEIMILMNHENECQQRRFKGAR